jgi:hypothetical protein
VKTIDISRYLNVYLGSRTNTGDILINNDASTDCVACYPHDEIKRIDTYKKDDSFRGGSRGKGGKTKYRRK